jgi:hypothetical protein
MLERCKVVVPRKTTQTQMRQVILADGSYVEQSHEVMTEIRYDRFDGSGNVCGSSSQTLTAPIQMIRLWGTYLRVALECEQKGIEVDGVPIAINRDFYEGWDIDHLLYTKFNDWFFGRGAVRGKEGWSLGVSPHRHLFLEEEIGVLNALDFEAESFSNDHVYIKVPKNRYRSQVGREVDLALKPHLLELGVDKRIDRFKLSGVKTPYIHLHKRYNILIQKLNGKSRKEIMDWINEKYDHVAVAKQQGRTKVYNKETKTIDFLDPALDKQVISHEQSISREWVKGAKNLRRVAQGVFP